MHHNQSNPIEKFLQHTVSLAINSHTPDHTHGPSLFFLVRLQSRPSDQARHFHSFLHPAIQPLHMQHFNPHSARSISCPWDLPPETNAPGHDFLTLSVHRWKRDCQMTLPSMNAGVPRLRTVWRQRARLNEASTQRKHTNQNRQTQRNRQFLYNTMKGPCNRFRYEWKDDTMNYRR